MPIHSPRTALLLAACCAGPALAQAPMPAASAPAAADRPAFEGYRAYAEPPPADWRQANDTVGRIGGWRTYAREAQAATETAPAPDQGHDHHHHGGQR